MLSERKPSGSAAAHVPSTAAAGAMRGRLWRCIRVLASLVILGFFLHEAMAAHVEQQYNTLLVRTRDRGFTTHHRKGVFPFGL